MMKTDNPLACPHNRIRNRDTLDVISLSVTFKMKVSNFSPSLPVTAGDIDPSMNLVEVTPEAKAELAKIENKIGDFICRLCKEVYDDAFGLAQHR